MEGNGTVGGDALMPEEDGTGGGGAIPAGGGGGAIVPGEVTMSWL
jgi:hypothetical protein